MVSGYCLSPGPRLLRVKLELDAEDRNPYPLSDFSNSASSLPSPLLPSCGDRGAMAAPGAEGAGDPNAGREDTRGRVAALRKLMAEAEGGGLDAYIIPSEDAHQVKRGGGPRPSSQVIIPSLQVTRRQLP